MAPKDGVEQGRFGDHSVGTFMGFSRGYLSSSSFSLTRGDGLIRSKGELFQIQIFIIQRLYTWASGWACNIPVRVRGVKETLHKIFSSCVDSVFGACYGRRLGLGLDFIVWE